MANQTPQSPAIKTSDSLKSETADDSPSPEALAAVRGFMAAFANAQEQVKQLNDSTFGSITGGLNIPGF